MNELYEQLSKQMKTWQQGRGKNSATEKNLKPVMLLAPIYFSSLIIPLWNCLTPSFSSFTICHRNHFFPEALQFVPAWVSHVDLRHPAFPITSILQHGQ